MIRLVKRTRISEKVFTYWHNPRFDPEWTWDGVVFYNEDISNSVLNSDVFKVMCSSGSHTTVLVNQKPVDIEIQGKPVIIVTAATANPSKEVLRRFTIVNLDESIDQTKKIMACQARKATEAKSTQCSESISSALSKLQRVSVKIPYAEKLVEFFPTDHVLMRTHFERFLDYIKASAALHQFQREEDEEGNLIAAGQDYDIARIALIKTTSNQSMVPLTKKQQKILAVFKKLDSDALVSRKYSVTDLEAHISFMSDRQLRRELDKLTDDGFLDKDKEDREGSKREVMVYSCKQFTNIELPSWNDIENRAIDKIDTIDNDIEDKEEAECKNSSSLSTMSNESSMSSVSNKEETKGEQ